MNNTAETLMRKYGYSYCHARDLLDEPYVKDLLNENRILKKEQKNNQRRIKRLQEAVSNFKKGK